MKTLILAFLITLPFFAKTQNLDTATFRIEIDTMLAQSKRLTEEKKYSDAMQLARSADSLCMTAFEKNSLLHAKTLSGIGQIFYNQKDYAQALSYIEEAFNIYQNKKAIFDQEYSDNSYQVAYCKLLLQKYEAAKSQCIQHLELIEKAKGKENKKYAKGLTLLGHIYREDGFYEQAIIAYSKSLELNKILYGQDHTEYNTSLNLLAIPYAIMGDYETAEPMFLQSLTFHEKNSGKETTHYAHASNNLGYLYLSMGNYEQAEPYLLEAKELFERVFGYYSERHVLGLNNLANLSNSLKKYEKTIAYCKKAKNIMKDSLGTERWEYGYTLINLGRAHQYLGLYKEAERHFLDALDVRERILGKDHHDYSNTVLALAYLYRDLKQYDKAEAYFKDAMSIYENSYGKTTNGYAETAIGLGKLHWRAKRNKEASLRLKESGDIYRELILRATRYTSEQEMTSFINLFIDNLDIYYSYAQLHKDKEFRALCYDYALFEKGFLLNTASSLRQFAASNTEAAEKFELLKVYHRRLASQYALPKEKQSGTAELEAKVNTIEKELAATYTKYGNGLQQVTWQEVQSRLNANEAAIEFISYDLYDPSPTGTTQYAAMVLRPDNPTPAFIPLCTGSEVNETMDNNSIDKKAYLNQLYIADNKSLYNLFWSRLEPELTDISTIYFAASGLLNRVNLNAIANTKNKSLSEKYRLIQLNSTRQLVIPQQIKNQINSAIIYGGIEFDIKTGTLDLSNSPISQDNSSASRGNKYFNENGIALRGEKWNRLPWTEIEAAALQIILEDAGIEAKVRSDTEATEEIFKTIGQKEKSPRILHIATHGFFFPDSQSEVRDKSLSSEKEPVFKVSDNPMIRSGLILAGGNYAWKNGEPFKPNMEDGILTAYEISQMDLSNTELVVLSACETGLGDIEGNEGVYGLQRAFKIAGAKYLIMSLWQVPDFQTQELMTAFYTYWLENKMEIPDAFRAAQKEMREKYEEPYLWAGFVLVE